MHVEKSIPNEPETKTMKSNKEGIKAEYAKLSLVPLQLDMAKYVLDAERENECTNWKLHSVTF